MLANMNEVQVADSANSICKIVFVTMQQRRGVPEVFGDGLGRAADLSFVTQRFDVLPWFWVFNSETTMETNNNLMFLQRREQWLTPAPTPVSTWKTREEEVLGWAGYLDELSSLGSWW